MSHKIDESTYDVIIVGGGAAGLTSGAYLSNYGYNILLCEQSSVTGGLINSFQWNEFLFDGGIRGFENSRILLPMLTQLRIHIDFISSPVSIGLSKDIIRFLKKENLEEYSLLLKKYFSNNEEEIALIIQELYKIMGHMDVIYGIDNPLFVDYQGDKKYLLETLLPWLFRYNKEMKQANRLNLPVNDHLRKLTSNNSLIDVITQHFFKETPAYFALSYFGLYLDYLYPRGGTNTFPYELTKYIKERNGMIMVDTKIEAVDLQAKTLTASDGTSFSYNYLIWACDQTILYQSISTTNNQNSRRRMQQQKLVEQSIPTESILTLFLATSIPMDEIQLICGPHCFYTPTPSGVSDCDISDSAMTALNHSEEDSVHKKIRLQEKIIKYLERTTYEISCPCLKDNSLAPVGHSGLIISTLFDYDIVEELSKDGWYKEFKVLSTTTILKILEEHLFPTLSSRLLYDSLSTPLTLKNHTLNFKGAITGWSFQNKKLPSYCNLKKINKAIKTPFPHVYQAGQWTFSPAGLPICLLTGKLAADQIHKRLKKN